METIGKPIALILKEELLKRQRKNEGYSLRAFSKAMGLSSSFVSKVLSGKKNLSEETILLIASRLKLEGQALEDFSFHLEKNKNVEFEELNIDNFQYISDWQHYALLELLTLSDFKSDVFWIAEKLDISIEKVESSLARLERINLIARDKKGNFSSYNKNLTTVNQKAPSSAHTEHERQLLKKALEALDSVDPAERSQSSMTMAIPSRRLKEAREKIKLFQREMNSLLQRKGPRDSVYNLSISFFPLTETKKTKKKEIQMKTFILTAILATGLTAFAGQENYGIGQDQYQPEAIYKALKVKEKHLNPGIAGIGRFEKSVGGLTCTREQLVAPNAKPTFECSIDQSKENFARIYKALDAKEKFLNPGIAGVSRFEKSVGGLTCIREQLVAPNAKPTFECQMTE